MGDFKPYFCRSFRSADAPFSPFRKRVFQTTARRSATTVKGIAAIGFSHLVRFAKVSSADGSAFSVDVCDGGGSDGGGTNGGTSTTSSLPSEIAISSIQKDNLLQSARGLFDAMSDGDYIPEDDFELVNKEGTLSDDDEDTVSFETKDEDTVEEVTQTNKGKK